MIDPTKPIRRKSNGTAARIVETNLKSPYGQYIVVSTSTNEPSVETYGVYNTREIDNVFENVLDRTERFINFYPNMQCAGWSNTPGHATREEADKWADKNRVAVLRLVFEDGNLSEAHIESV